MNTHRRTVDENDSGGGSGIDEGYEEIEENDVPLEEERF